MHDTLANRPLASPAGTGRMASRGTKDWLPKRRKSRAAGRNSVNGQSVCGRGFSPRRSLFRSRPRYRLTPTTMLRPRRRLRRLPWPQWHARQRGDAGHLRSTEQLSLQGIARFPQRRSRRTRPCRRWIKISRYPIFARSRIISPPRTGRHNPAAAPANPAAAPPDAIAGKIEMCKACHQKNFEGGPPGPRLAGLSYDYLCLPP